MAITFIRYNESSKYYEYDSSAAKDGSGPWLILPIDASQISQGILDTGSGIKFPAIQNASADANTLDDYEEGTWTPTDTSGAGLALTITSAVYIKFGRLVVACSHLDYPSTADTSLSRIGGLPFTVEAAIHAVVFGFNNSGTSITGYADASSTNILIYAAGSPTRRTNAQLSTSTMIFNAIYRAAA